MKCYNGNVLSIALALLIWFLFHHKSFHLSASAMMNHYSVGPSFSFAVQEESAIGTVIGQIPRGSYRISAPQKIAELVAIDGRDGVLRVAKRLDREEHEGGQVKFTLISTMPSRNLTDKSSAQNHRIVPPSNTVIDVELRLLDVNDHSPLFSLREQEINIPENSPIGSRYRIPSGPARDPDFRENGTISHYELRGVNFTVERMFKLVMEDGELYLELIGELDREIRTEYSAVLKAVDAGKPPRTGNTTLRVLVIDINDNAPRFVFGNDSHFDNSTNTYTLHLPMVTNHTEGNAQLIVGQTRAFDPDDWLNGRVGYRLITTDDAESGEREFTIDEESGELYRTWSGHHSNADKTIEVEAFDHGKPRLATRVLVKLVANESEHDQDLRVLFMPSTNKTAVRVDPLTKNGTLLGVFTTTSKSPTEGNVSIEISKGNEENTFQLDSFGSYALLRWNRNGTRGVTKGPCTLHAEAVGPNKRAKLEVVVDIIAAADDDHPLAKGHPTDKMADSSNVTKSLVGTCDGCPYVPSGINSSTVTGKGAERSERAFTSMIAAFVLTPLFLLLLVLSLIVLRWRCKRKVGGRPSKSGPIYILPAESSNTLNTGLSVIAVNSDDAYSYYCTIGDLRP